MSWLNRLRTSLRADAHGLVDALADRSLLLKQHLRDAEAAVQHKRGKLVALEAEHKRLLAEHQRCAVAAASHERDAELALDSGRDDLARYALKLHLSQRQLLQRLDARLVQLDDERRELDRVVQEQTRALEELRTRVNVYLAETESATELGHESAGASVSDEQIELELLRRREARAEKAESPESPDA